ncbi:hypothetical protein [Piscinibacter sp. XHJ-5]|uniref:hypothetical protein n=1 Tax=Piscinibacter sp. XHJ-5 TaxID=3037797 RepID=UPI002452E210|nr:hypothetical protein [Piscinibacter sp. XHJ-5]
MRLVHDALRAGQAAPPRTPARARRVLVAGGAGALGAAVLESLLASRGFDEVAVLVTQPINAALRGLATVSKAQLEDGAVNAEDTALVVFDRERHANGREAAFLRPQPQALPLLAAALYRRGVRDLIVVMPHATATLPDALKRGLATLDEQAVAALGFDHLVFVRSAQPPAALRAASALQRVADWVLSQLQLMIPQRERPVRAQKVAQFVVQVALRLPATAHGTRVAPPELVWEAGQTKDLEGLAAGWLA